jgi:hypothetical protein
MADITNSLGFDMLQATLDERSRAIDNTRWQRELKAIDAKERAQTAVPSVETEATCETPLTATKQVPSV